MEKYILFVEKVYTFLQESIYLLCEKYIGFYLMGFRKV